MRHEPCVSHTQLTALVLNNTSSITAKRIHDVNAQSIGIITLVNAVTFHMHCIFNLVQVSGEKGYAVLKV